MSTKFHVAAVSSLALFALLALNPSARADQIQVTGHTDLSACASPASFDCMNVTYNLIFNTQSALLMTGEPVQEVFGITGTINGQAVSAPAGSGTNGDGYLIFSQTGFGNIGPRQWVVEPDMDEILYRVAGFSGEGIIGFEDMLVGAQEIDGPNGSSYVTWNSNLITTPEPSTLLLSCIGMMAALACLGLKRLIG